LLLGGGAVLAGLLLGAIVAFLIDREFFWAAGYAAAGAVLGFIGLIHGAKVGWDIGGQIALGYLLTSAIFLIFGLLNRRQGGTELTDSADPELVAADAIDTEPAVASDNLAAEPVIPAEEPVAAGTAGTEAVSADTAIPRA
jgi:AGZA family xanthine/uracil permease-like MFS transporter